MIRELIVPWFLDLPRPGLDRIGGSSTLQRAPVQTLGARPTGGDTLSAIEPIHAEIAAFTLATYREGDLPLIVAGDCCAAIPVAAALDRARIDPVLVWLDAHGDFNTHGTSTSGFLGGMPLAMLTGRGEQALLRGSGMTPIPDERVRLGDARDLDLPEAAALRQSAVFHASRIDALLGSIAPGTPVHLHLDCDVIRAEEVPAQSYPVPDGPSAAEVEGFLAALAERAEISAISVCAWDPALDDDDCSARICRRCIDAACALG